MITAKGAREKATLVNGDVIKEQLDKVNEAINLAAERGEYSIDYYNLLKDVVLKLESLGYVVKEHPYSPTTGRPTLYVISW